MRLEHHLVGGYVRYISPHIIIIIITDLTGSNFHNYRLMLHISLLNFHEVYVYNNVYDLFTKYYFYSYK